MLNVEKSGVEETEELVVVAWVEIMLVLVDIEDSETQRICPIERSQFASNVGLKA